VPWKWYVYEITRGEEVIYVGKGCGKRMFVSAKLKDGEPREVARFSDEAAAYGFEKSLIADRVKNGCILRNVKNGFSMSWEKRTDSRNMAREVLEDLAYKFGRWIKAGKVHVLAARTRIPVWQIFQIHQQFGK